MTRSSLPVVVVNSDLRQAIPQRIPREPKQTRCLRFVAASALQSLTNHFVFPLVKRHSVGEKAIGRSTAAIARRVKLNVGDFQLAARSKRAGAFDDVLQFTHLAWPIMPAQKLHGGRRNAGDGFRSSGILGEAREEQVR